MIRPRRGRWSGAVAGGGKAQLHARAGKLQRVRLSTRRIALLAFVALVALVALSANSASAATWVVGRDGKTLQETVDRAAAGDVVEVPAGVWAGPVTIKQPIRFVGTGVAVSDGASGVLLRMAADRADNTDKRSIIDGGGKGKTVIVEAAGTIVENLEIRNGGHDLTGSPDSGIFVAKNAGTSIIRNNRVVDCAFGIWVEEADKTEVSDNTVIGRSEIRATDRGNGVHVFKSKNLLVRNNYVRGARDGVYVFGVEDSFIEDNVSEDLRFGVHYMFSYHNKIRRNRTSRNSTGFALMQSIGLIVEDNIAEDNEEHAILFRDATDCEIRRNIMRRNGEGFFFFSSVDNIIEDNLVLHNEVGATIWAGSIRNRVSNNTFVGNRRQVMYVGTSDLVFGETDPGNYWSDYIGWDQDGDGYGDRPYRMQSFASNVIYRYPSAAMLMHSPAIELLSHLEERMPILRVPTIVDQTPRMNPVGL